MRASVLLCVALTACAQSPAQDGSPAVESHVETFELPGGYDAKLDLLFVLDDTATSAAYAERTQQMLRDLEGIWDPLWLPDLHVAVTTADPADAGAFQRAPDVDGAFLVDELAPSWWTRITNHRGSIGDAVAELGAIGSGGTASAPLAAMRTALEHGGEFRRPDAMLGVVIVSASDDASSDAPETYAAWLRGMQSDPNLVGVTVIAPANAPRLTTFAQQFPNRASTASIDDASYTQALSVLTDYVKITLEGHCVPEPLDVDPAPGLQAECTIEIVQRDGVIANVDACPAEHCWSFEPNPPAECPDGGGTFRIGPYRDRWPSGIRGQCVTR